MTPASAKAGARTGSDACTPALRCDARANGSRIFAEQGLEAPLAGVVRRAGGGIATMVGRLPAKVDLTTARFATTMAEHVGAIEQALAGPDLWPGFCGCVEGLISCCFLVGDSRRW